MSLNLHSWINGWRSMHFSLSADLWFSIIWNGQTTKLLASNFPHTHSQSWAVRACNESCKNHHLTGYKLINQGSYIWYCNYSSITYATTTNKTDNNNTLHLLMSLHQRIIELSPNRLRLNWIKSSCSLRAFAQNCFPKSLFDICRKFSRHIAAHSITHFCDLPCT